MGRLTILFTSSCLVLATGVHMCMCAGVAVSGDGTATDTTDPGYARQGALLRGRQTNHHQMKKLVFVSDSRVLFVQRRKRDILEDCLTHKRSVSIRVEAKGVTAVDITELEMDAMYRQCQAFTTVKAAPSRRKYGG